MIQAQAHQEPLRSQVLQKEPVSELRGRPEESSSQEMDDRTSWASPGGRPQNPTALDFHPIASQACTRCFICPADSLIGDEENIALMAWAGK